MKLLLDTCVWGGLKHALVDAGHDIVWAGDWSEDPGDEEILEQAFRDGRVLVTLDKDFGELAVVRKTPHGGILRLVALSTKGQASACMTALQHYADELEAGAIVTAEMGRIRIRPPEE